ncbi:secondary thiamine-phosphate synthase enzyme YjbQ [Haladaptatus pallidirubidus]|uniref:Secondary thiamine-phosphate synthase enzyme YjbQ n=1 Tax=Haladaptatus pallidirubidus TaxID=1008152 RepID=A0AAV3UC45_9EURY|nr:secondary thiamine-phosphate synthase enzyme YjbQ [Haladaptatus pallidirubidus]
MEFEVSTSKRVDVVDITEQIERRVFSDADTCTVFVPHTTAGVVVNENESRLLADLETALSSLVPESGGYQHDEVDDNADAHLRSLLLGSSVTIPVTNGSLALGTWQSVLFVDCDGPRTRRIIIR